MAEHEGQERMLRLELEFDGTAFSGWQRQSDRRTVQGEVEAALARILGGPHPIVGAGRTDAGAHARRMVVSCPTRHAMPAPQLARALDAVLPEDIGVRAVLDAPPGFHARRDALWKWYRYRILRSAGRRPLERRTTWHLRARLDFGALEAGARVLEGCHDFAAFSNAGSPRRTTVRTLQAVRWSRPTEELLVLDVVGNGFLYKMVRNIVGTLVGVARGPEAGRAEAVVRAVLEGGVRTEAGAAAPAAGLTLMQVGFQSEDLAACLPPFLLRAVESRSPDPRSRLQDPSAQEGGAC